MMGGWKTWTAGILSILYGVGGWLADIHEADKMSDLVIQGIAIIGLGHKIEKLPESIPVPPVAAEKKDPIGDLVKRHQK